MEFKKYKILFSPSFAEKVEDIYLYISKKLKEKKIAKDTIISIKNRILMLERFPYAYPKINIRNKLKSTYRKMIVKNYVIVYNVDEKEKQVKIVDIYYQKENYLNKI